MDSLAFLERAGRGKPQPIYVVFGDEEFLKRRVLAAIQALVLGESGDDFGLSMHAGDSAAFAAVHDDLDTVPFLSPRRLVVVTGADPFITNYRALLEKYVAQPSATGVLVLDVKAWPSNTRLYKLIDSAGAIACKAPKPATLPAWCVQWAESQHGKKLAGAAAQLLVELVGTDMGQLEQELAKLAVYIGERARIDTADVDLLVGRSRAAETFKIFDAIANGRTAEALGILDRLFDEGAEPLAILGAFSWQLRRLAQAARLAQQGKSLAAAMDEVGVNPYFQRAFEQQLRHLGRRRIDRLYDWLLETDLGLKGSSALPERTQLERLIIRLARPRTQETRT
jgi:DNA polymerase-3 subunit delta